MHARAIQVADLPIALSENWVDTGRKPFVKDGIAYIPVKQGYQFSVTLPERRRCGRGYQRLGEIIVFHGPRPDDTQVLEVIDRHQPKGVIWTDSHQGITRKPKAEVIWGEVGEVLHKEAGVVYLLDPLQVMFSQGNREEKIRISSLVLPGERVCDMFAGIGYFTLQLARAGAKVRAIEINPVAFRYLQENVRLNRLEDQVTLVFGNCKDHITKSISNPISDRFDRIIMGHFDSVASLPSALKVVGPGSVIHIHSIGKVDDAISMALSLAGAQAKSSLHKVKKVGPRRWHYVTDLVIG